MALSLPVNPRDEEVDMAPMIDMVFLLLVFFMVSSHLQSEEYFPLEIPLASTANVPTERTDRVVVSILHEEAGDGIVHMLGASAMALEDIATIVAERNEAFLASRGGEDRLRLVIRAPADMEHGEVRKVMRMGAEAGISDIIFATHELLD
ncbi:MAG: biopolymer transporter ExbD [Verrucomicrobia bacterium]|nr:biopolymer transporter ExbD [Verrucomicrobiota bacterium]MCH8513764.1 biopolymer transporter ExbD [Kiritimatiellia bacterium]